VKKSEVITVVSNNEAKDEYFFTLALVIGWPHQLVSKLVTDLF